MKNKTPSKIVAEVSVRTRKAIAPLWDAALTKARSWGRKLDGRNRFYRTNIMYSCSEGNNIVIIAFTDEGEAIVHEYTHAVNSDLGKETKRLLREAGIPILE